MLYNKNPTNWSMIASHLPGRTGGECRDAWQAIVAGEPEAAQLESSARARERGGGGGGGGGDDDDDDEQAEDCWWEWEKPRERLQQPLRVTLRVAGGRVRLSVRQVS